MTTKTDKDLFKTTDLYGDSIVCLCGKPVNPNEFWYDGRISGIKYCSKECAQKFGDQNENGKGF